MKLKNIHKYEEEKGSNQSDDIFWMWELNIQNARSRLLN
jgi:hypothetical protein